MVVCKAFTIKCCETLQDIITTNFEEQLISNMPQNQLNISEELLIVWQMRCNLFD